MHYGRTFKIVTLFIGITGCRTKAVPDEAIEPDPAFMKLFTAMTNKDTICFKNARNAQKVFVITHIDSSMSNSKGGFMDPAPYKDFTARIREIGNDTTALDRENNMYIAKVAEENANWLHIAFNNLYFFEDTLPHLDTVGRYAFLSNIKPTNPTDVKLLYISPTDGWQGFITLSGEEWTRYHQ